MSKIIQKLTIIFTWSALLVVIIIALNNSNQPVHAQEGDVTPTPNACSSPGLQSLLGNVNVRSGPGLEYGVVGTLPEAETRPIVGRAEFTQWWQIELDEGTNGWVANETVNIQGDISAVPIVEPPLLPDSTIPTPGPAWIPAVNTLCITAEPTTEEATSVDTSNEWDLPLNLSRSGASTEPRMVIDSNGLFHVIWKDTVNGFLYIQGNGLEWSQPITVELPFGTRIYYPDLNETEETPYFIPNLVADKAGNIHAFWIDDEGGLYYSSVAATEFTTFASWRTRQTLGASALNLDAIVDQNGQLHLTYIRPLDSETAPPGIYYRQSIDNGGEWSAATLIYQSSYYHAITPDQTNINLISSDSTETTQLFIAWDNRSLGQVLAARSTDGGLSWENPIVMDSREQQDVAESVNPGQIAVGASGDDVIMVWQAGHNAEICAHYFTYSSDGGQTWQPRQQLEQPRGCHRTNQILVTNDGYMILMALVEEVVGTRGHLIAWNGEEWSDPQEQSILNSFQNPETFLEVSFQCHQSTFVNPNSLFVLGCDGNDGKDIWLTRRSIQDVEAWYATPAIWQPPAIVGSQPGRVSSMNLLSDGDGLLHLIWARENEPQIYYSIQNNLFWTEPVAVLRALEGNSEKPAAALSNNGRILVAWSSASSGQIYFSSAESSRATAQSDWSPIQVVSELGLAAHSPQLTVTHSGVIYIAYTVPLNEERGVYLVHSEDNGETWTPAIKIFDGVENGWSIVGEPTLAITNDGNLHILLTHFQNLTNDRPLGIFYSRSEDAGVTWSTPFLVAEQPVITGSLFGYGLETLHRIWFDEGNSGLDVWNDLSIDSGQSWNDATSATGFGQVDQPMVLTTDPAGRVHVLGVRDLNLQHWIWEGNRWMIQTETSLNPDNIGEVYELGATIATNGQLEVVFAIEETDSLLYYTGRQLEIPAFVPEPIPEPTITTQPATAVATEEIEETPIPSPTPPQVVTPTPGDISSTPPDGQDNSILDIALSFVPALLVVGVAFVFGLRSIRGRRKLDTRD